MSLQNFDVLSYLDERGISYQTGGNNVSDGWIGVNCPFCLDHSNHLGIHLGGKGINCWICGTTGTVEKYIMEKENISYYAAKEIIREHQNPFTEEKKPRINREFKTILPEHYQPIDGSIPTPVYEYLKRRNFPSTICEKYKLGWVKLGEYQSRLIVPVFLKGFLVSFQAMDVTGKAGVKYIDCPADRAIFPNKHLLYGIDDCTNQLIIVEGVTDKWRIGKDAAALFTKNFTKEQLNLVTDYFPKDFRIKIVLDADADEKAELIACELSSVFNNIVLLSLDYGDPADMSREDVKALVDY